MNPLRFSHSILLGLTAGLCLVVCAFCAYAGEESNAPALTAPAQTTQLRALIQVDSEGVFLDQLVESGPELPHLRLCDAPVCGKALLLKRADLTQLARAAGSDQVFTNWAGPESARISRRLRPLAEKDVLKLLTSVLQEHYVKEQGELELQLSRPWAAVSVPDESFSIKLVDVPTTGVTPAFIARFEMETAHGEHVGTWQVSLQAKVWREVWVTRSAVKRGDSVRGADLARERRDMLLCHEAVADLTPDDPALEFVQPVQSGVTLVARLIRPRAIVRRGQSLAAKVQDGTLTITLKVEALEDGAAGQTIRVRNPLSRRDLHGKILDEQNILVLL